MKLNLMKSNITVVEMVLFKLQDGVGSEQGQQTLQKLNNFLKQQKGFVARKTAEAEDGYFLDIVYWTDLDSAKSASEKAMQDPEAAPVFSIIAEESMTFKHFRIFNSVENAS